MIRGISRSVALIAVVALAMTSGGGASMAAEDWVPLHLESFLSATGPRDEVGPPVEVTWCRVDGRLVASGFCPTGSAWRLDPGDRLVATLHPSAECDRIRAWVYAASVDAPLSWMAMGVPGACEPIDGVVVPVVSTGAACLDLSIDERPSVDGTLQWTIVNSGPAVMLVDEWFVEGLDCESGETHDCCEVGVAGCADPVVRDCVCAVDPFCCEFAWDQACLEAVEDLGCGDCGESCDEGGFATDFGTLYEPGGVCAAFPELFESCEGAGPYLTISGGCAGIGDAALRFGGGFPWSSIETRCIDLTGATTATLRFTVSTEPGVPGPVIDAQVGDDPPMELARVPISASTGCRVMEVDLAAVVGREGVRLRIRSGSSVAEATRLDDLALEIDPMHAPCETGGPGADDAAIVACTCEIDQYCCSTAWDALCVTIATLVCDAECGSIPTCGLGGACDVVDPEPGCEDVECCGIVCAVDPFCCVVAWDAACVAAAAGCGGPDPDLDGDGDVDGADLGLLLAGWGSASPLLDLDLSGQVDGGDLGLLLAAWSTG